MREVRFMARYDSGYGFGGYHLTPWVKRLMIANGAIFIATWVMPWLISYLAFQPSAVLLRPWTLLTYMFTHGGFWHIFFNLLALFFFGPPIEERWGSQEFIKYYMVCGLGGAALSFVFAFNSPVVGASAAVYGVMLAFAMMWPDVPIYIWGIFPVKAKWLVIALGVLSFLSAFGGSADNVAHFAHLGGFAAGYLYFKIDRKTGGPFLKMRKLFTRRRFKVVPGASGKPEPPRARRRDEDRVLDEVDRVLDKISTQGMASLTPEERRLLDEVSRRYRQN
ncbi:MAG: rhomboid family intramembrane serine protease [Gemmatimonadota bacterium]